MRVVVTGSNGFIGSNLKSLLTAKGFEISEINDDTLGLSDWSQRLPKMLDTFRPSCIFHVGANSNTLETKVNKIMISNFESTKVLMNWAAESGTPLIYSSSAAIYGETGESPSNLYGWSKYVAECYVSRMGGVSLRYFNVYGPGEENKGTMASVFYQAAVAQRKKIDFKLFPGKPERDFVFVGDIARANFVAFQEYSRITGQIFEVGTGVQHTFEEGLDIMHIPYSYYDQSQIPIGYQFKTKSRRECWIPGWSPKFDLKSGLNLYCDYLAIEE